ncbi:uncharacterized protein BT62DRAFT_922765 [Guyanagaster necrorhizus]|uniref:Uncharacterized protein n=1 Tax=Guyanagaster necrorhizus TaxID=856835 RepID=A0A9P7VKG1_9AGAR|nr:uncharacterized protein BT62DRAFT_922765 [Guyanagaster necrorhizus MCA 3950]KAG7442359.1 hypothetical protein BT62DRAFT_922765 [Guyanagaster necrorhizus MCA 3950]
MAPHPRRNQQHMCPRRYVRSLCDYPGHCRLPYRSSYLTSHGAPDFSRANPPSGEWSNLVTKAGHPPSIGLMVALDRHPSFRRRGTEYIVRASDRIVPMALIEISALRFAFCQKKNGGLQYTHPRKTMKYLLVISNERAKQHAIHIFRFAIRLNIRVNSEERPRFERCALPPSGCSLAVGPGLSTKLTYTFASGLSPHSGWKLSVHREAFEGLLAVPTLLLSLLSTWIVSSAFALSVVSSLHPQTASSPFHDIKSQIPQSKVDHVFRSAAYKLNSGNTTSLTSAAKSIAI